MVMVMFVLLLLLLLLLFVFVFVLLLLLLLLLFINVEVVVVVAAPVVGFAVVVFLVHNYSLLSCRRLLPGLPSYLICHPVMWWQERPPALLALLEATLQAS